jgi:branched-chain amino acid transport system ATP-binding protein
VWENLQLQVPRWKPDRSIDIALDVFPALAPRLGQAAGTMSGGQQQMLALSRAFLAEPALVALDEVSMGLAPIVVEQIFAALRRLAGTGVAMLVVEQYVSQALEFATEAHVMRRGSLVYSGPAQELNQDELLDSYLGEAAVPTPETHGRCQ